MPATPSPDRPLRLGTRRSPLAMAQAEETRARLAAAHGWAQEAIALVPVLASGDRIQDRPLSEIGGKALWTRELDSWLAEGRIDAAVHSLKDVETIRPPAFAIAAVLPRADKADRLLGAATIAGLPRGAVVGTSAPRRAAQLLHARPDCRVATFRGNVATRMAKLAAGEVDATFLAAAGLDRLGENEAGHRLDPREWLPAPSQGAIGVEALAERADLAEWFAAIDHAPSRAEVTAERALLATLGGSCHSPVAVLCEYAANEVTMTAALYSEDGRHTVRGEARWSAGAAPDPGPLAQDLLARAPAEIRALFAGCP